MDSNTHSMPFVKALSIVVGFGIAFIGIAATQNDVSFGPLVIAAAILGVPAAGIVYMLLCFVIDTKAQIKTPREDWHDIVGTPKDKH